MKKPGVFNRMLFYYRSDKLLFLMSKYTTPDFNPSMRYSGLKQILKVCRKQARFASEYHEYINPRVPRILRKALFDTMTPYYASDAMELVERVISAINLVSEDSRNIRKVEKLFGETITAHQQSAWIDAYWNTSNVSTNLDVYLQSFCRMVENVIELVEPWFKHPNEETMQRAEFALGLLFIVARDVMDAVLFIRYTIGHNEG